MTMLIGYLIIAALYWVLMFACMMVAGDAGERRTFGQLSVGAPVWPLMLTFLLIAGVLRMMRSVYSEIDREDDR